MELLHTQDFSLNRFDPAEMGCTCESSTAGSYFPAEREHVRRGIAKVLKDTSEVLAKLYVGEEFALPSGPWGAIAAPLSF